MTDYTQTSPRRAALVAALRRSAALIVVLTLLGAGLGLAAGLLRSQSHTARASVLISPLVGNPYYPGGQGEELINLETEAQLVVLRRGRQRRGRQPGGRPHTIRGAVRAQGVGPSEHPDPDDRVHRRVRGGRRGAGTGVRRRLPRLPDVPVRAGHRAEDGAHRRADRQPAGGPDQSGGPGRGHHQPRPQEPLRDADQGHRCADRPAPRAAGGAADRRRGPRPGDHTGQRGRTERAQVGRGRTRSRGCSPDSFWPSRSSSCEPVPSTASIAPKTSTPRACPCSAASR